MAKSKKRKSEGVSTQDAYVAVDVGFNGFQADFKKLSTEQQNEFFSSITKIQAMTWQQIWDTSSKTSGQKRGFNYEPIDGQLSPAGEQVHSIRITLKFRARVIRQGRWMRFISLHPDHDSTYK